MLPVTHATRLSNSRRSNAPSTCRCAGSVAKFDFGGKIRKLGISNSITYRLLNSRKCNFATEPFLLLGHIQYACDAQRDRGNGVLARLTSVLVPQPLAIFYAIFHLQFDDHVSVPKVENSPCNCFRLTNLPSEFSHAEVLEQVLLEFMLLVNNPPLEDSCVGHHSGIARKIDQYLHEIVEIVWTKVWQRTPHLLDNLGKLDIHHGIPGQYRVGLRTQCSDAKLGMADNGRHHGFLPITRHNRAGTFKTEGSLRRL